METTTYIGIAAGVCTAVSMLPQLLKIIKEKKAADISLIMLLILVVGIGLWVYYGVLRKDYPIILTNSFSLIVNILIIIFTVRYKHK